MRILIFLSLLAAAHAAARDPFKEATGKDRVALLTPFGRIVFKLLPDNAPKAVAALQAAAKRRDCRDCKFYRAEARPNEAMGQPPTGPPYALLQGQLTLPSPVPLEGRMELRAGHVAFIPGTSDFFIALRDHSEWGTAHTVVAEIEDFVSTDLIAIQWVHEVKHEQYGTVMRMMDTPVTFDITDDVEDR